MARIDRFGGNNTPQSSDELHEKNERAKVAGKEEGAKDEATGVALSKDGVRKIMAPQDAERLVSQAGFARAKKRRPGDLDMGDSSQAPIPLPEDDVDSSMWSAEALTDVQAQLGVQSSLLRAVREQAAAGQGSALPGGAKGLWQAMVGAAFGEDGEGGQADGGGSRLAVLTQTPPPDPKGMARMAQGAQSHFGIELAGLDPGAQLMAASLLVAGQHTQVAVVPAEGGAQGDTTLDGSKLTTGVEAVLNGGRAAVDDGRRMNEGVVKNLAMHRTFVAKR